jgi:hypothetical protein
MINKFFDLNYPCARDHELHVYGMLGSGAKIHNCRSPASFPGNLPGIKKGTKSPNMYKRMNGGHMEQDAFLK